MSLPAPFSQIVVLFADSLIIATIPLHIRFLYILLSKKNIVDLEGPYYTILIHFTIHSIIFSISNSLILEPALLGIAPEFYKDNAFWLARIELAKATVLLVVGTVAQFLIALNRLTAIVLPINHSRIWTKRRVHIVFSIIWAIVFLLALPIMIDQDHIGSRLSLSVFSTTSVEYVFVGAYNDYQKRSIIPSKGVSFEKMLKLAFTSFVMTIGGWLIQLLITAMFIHIWLFNTPILQIRDLSVLFRFFNALHNVLMPWVIVCSYRTIQRMVFAYQCVPVRIAMSSVQQNENVHLDCDERSLY